jgi:hypothetical protein
VLYALGFLAPETRGARVHVAPLPSDDDCLAEPLEERQLGKDAAPRAHRYPWRSRVEVEYVVAVCGLGDHTESNRCPRWSTPVGYVEPAIRRIPHIGRCEVDNVAAKPKFPLGTRQTKRVPAGSRGEMEDADGPALRLGIG